MNLENKKQIAIILMAVALGLVAAILATNYVQTTIEKEANRRNEEFKQVYMAKVNQDMDAMRGEIQRLEEQQKEIAKQAADAALRAARGGTAAGAAVSGGAAGAPSSLALRTPAGKRAYTVMIDSLSAVGGLINPGDYVDVLAHMNLPDPSGGKSEKISTVVFQNVLILAVGVNLQAPSDGYEQQQKARSLTITFALTPVEAGLMSFLQQHGQMQLLLRAPEEKDVEVLDTASWPGLADYLMEKQGTELAIPRTRAIIEPVQVPSSEEVSPVIEIFQGGKLQN